MVSCLTPTSHVMITSSHACNNIHTHGIPKMPNTYIVCHRKCDPVPLRLENARELHDVPIHVSDMVLSEHTAIFCNPYSQNRSLYDASASGDLVKVKELVDKGADVTWHRPDWVSTFSIHVLKFSPGMLEC